MSQSATLYRISFDTFCILNKVPNAEAFNINSTKGYHSFQGSFMGLEYILSKTQDISAIPLLKQIFNPSSVMGSDSFQHINSDEHLESYEGVEPISYLDPVIIAKLDSILDSISDNTIDYNYNAEELNQKNIYPAIWHNDDSPDQVFNKRQILEDARLLKSLIKEAHKEKDYILVFVG